MTASRKIKALLKQNFPEIKFSVTFKKKDWEYKIKWANCVSNQATVDTVKTFLSKQGLYQELYENGDNFTFECSVDQRLEDWVKHCITSLYPVQWTGTRFIWKHDKTDADEITKKYYLWLDNGVSSDISDDLTLLQNQVKYYRNSQYKRAISDTIKERLSLANPQRILIEEKKLNICKVRDVRRMINNDPNAIYSLPRVYRKYQVHGYENGEKDPVVECEGLLYDEMLYAEFDFELITVSEYKSNPETERSQPKQQKPHLSLVIFEAKDQEISTNHNCPTIEEEFQETKITLQDARVKRYEQWVLKMVQSGKATKIINFEDWIDIIDFASS